MSQKYSANDVNKNMNSTIINLSTKYSPSNYHQIFDKFDAKGEIKFPGVHAKKAKYICIDKNSKHTDIVQYLYRNECFNLKKPKLILSIIGDEKKLEVSSTWKKAFKQGIVNAAKTSNAWILTGGLNVGIMRLVGDAIAEEISTENITLMGIQTWGVVAKRESLIVPKNSNMKHPYVARYYPDTIDKSKNDCDLSLNSNHTHFVFYNDGTTKELGNEILFRANLEYELSKGKSLRDYQNYSRTRTLAIPTVLIVVGGGPNTLRLIYLYKQKIPVLLCLGTKGCADLVEAAKNLSSEEKKSNEKLGELIDASQILTCITDSSALKIERDLAIKRLKEVIKDECVGKIVSAQLNIDTDVQAAILNALFRETANLAQNFKLELLWNRYQISNAESLQEKFEKLKPEDMDDLLDMALLENNYSFASAILEKGINLECFLTLERFYKYYNSKKNSKNKDLFSMYMHKTTVNFDENTPINSDYIRSFFEKRLFNKFNAFFLPENYNKKNGKILVKYAEQNLFIWCVLFNQSELAKLFWSIGENQITNGLLAAKILRLFAHFFTDLSSELVENANEFEDLAIGVINVFDKNTRDEMNSTLMLSKTPFTNMDCLSFAVDCKCKKFVALPSIQNIITNLWYNKLIHKTGSKFKFKFALCLISFGLLAPFLILKIESEEEVLDSDSVKMNTITSYDDNDHIKADDELNLDPEPNESNNKVVAITEVKITNTSEQYEGDTSEFAEFIPKTKTKVLQSLTPKMYWKYFLEFFKTPIVLYIYNTVFHVLFLVIFTILMISKFHYFDEMNIDMDYTEVNATRYDQILHRVSIISPFEVIVLIWVIGLSVEEFNQLKYSLGDSKNSISQNIKGYFNDSWNILDTLGCTLFFIGAIMRITSLWTSKEIFIWSRILLSLDLALWFIRTLFFCSFFKNAGPKIQMIRKMLGDLKIFLVIIGIFMLGFAISCHAILYPQKEFNLGTVFKVINIGYWTIFGEIFILDDINFKNCEENPSHCVEPTGAYICAILLMFYMVISAVLLINLVIAMFNSTYDAVQSNSDIHWKFQRYQLLSESKDFCYLPPPLNLLYYTIIVPINKTILKLLKKDVIVDVIDETEEIENIKDVNSNDMIDEQKCALKYWRDLKNSMRNTVDSKINYQIEKLNGYEYKFNEISQSRIEVSQKLNELAEINKTNQDKLNSYEETLKNMKENQKRLEMALANINGILEVTEIKRGMDPRRDSAHY